MDAVISKILEAIRERRKCLREKRLPYLIYIQQVKTLRGILKAYRKEKNLKKEFN